MNEKVKIWDIVLIAAMLAVCFVLCFLPKEKGKTVTVTVDGTVFAQKQLTEDWVIDLPDGARVVAENGTVCLIRSACPDHLCENMGKISSAGEVILCVPHRISVQIGGEGVDALVG